MSKGLTHIYYGDGKGKTTAAVGLAVRAAGNGLAVCFAQLMKTDEPVELSLLERLGITVMGGAQHTFSFLMNDEEKAAARVNNDAIVDAAFACPCDLLVLDEAINAYRTQLVSCDAFEHKVREKPDGLELVMTGRGPAPFMLEVADYATEMVCRKHPFKQGVAARKGIEY